MNLDVPSLQFRCAVVVLSLRLRCRLDVASVCVEEGYCPGNAQADEQDEGDDDQPSPHGAHRRTRIERTLSNSLSRRSVRAFIQEVKPSRVESSAGGQLGAETAADLPHRLP